MTNTSKPVYIKRPLVIVKWKDHCAEGGWCDVDNFHGPGVCFSVGWLYKEDDEGITLAAYYSPSDYHDYSTGNLQYILKGTIVERKIVQKADK